MNSKDIGFQEAKTRFCELLAEVERGTHFYITRDGKRVAEVSPVKAAANRPVFGCGRGIFTEVAEDFDAPVEEFRESVTSCWIGTCLRNPPIQNLIS